MKLRTVKRKVVELDVIDVNSRQLQEVEIKGHYGAFYRAACGKKYPS